MTNKELALWASIIGGVGVVPSALYRRHLETRKPVVTDETVSVPRGDLGLLYQLLKDLEWSAERFGCQPLPGELGQEGRACPTCFGVYPDDFVAADFPQSAFSHREDCKLVAMIRLLRSALGAIE